MTYAAKELSAHDSEPYRLYEFQNGDSIWRYTSREYEVVVGDSVFTPEQIDSGDVQNSAELEKQGFKVTVPYSNNVAKMFQFYPSTAVTTLKVWEYHIGEAENTLVWVGRVLSAEYLGTKSELRCEPLTTAMRRNGLNRMFQRPCPHILYGQELGSCGVNKGTHKVTAPVLGVDGLSVIVDAALEADYFAGGMLSWESVAGVQWRFILLNSANILSINFPTMPSGDVYGRSLEVGAILSLYPGCNHTMTHCRDRFNNLDNYGGQPYTPWDNPFDGAVIY